MNSRERVKSALGHNSPDKVPISIGSHCCDAFTKVALREFQEYLGLEQIDPMITSKMMGSVRTPENLLILLNSDFRTVAARKPTNSKVIQIGRAHV